MMKKLLSVTLILSMFAATLPMAYATNNAPSAESSLAYYSVDGEKYVDIADETYRYLELSDFKPVEDITIQRLLDADTTMSQSAGSEYLPVPPRYTYNLADGAYSGSVDLSNGDQWSPLIRRDVPKRYTNFKVDAVLNKTVSIGYFYYNALEGKWYGDSITDLTFNVLINTRQLQFGSMGDAAQGLRILFFNFDNSTQQFDYTLTDTDMPL